MFYHYYSVVLAIVTISYISYGSSKVDEALVITISSCRDWKQTQPSVANTYRTPLYIITTRHFEVHITIASSTAYYGHITLNRLCRVINIVKHSDFVHRQISDLLLELAANTTKCTLSPGCKFLLGIILPCKVYLKNYQYEFLSC